MNSANYRQTWHY